MDRRAISSSRMADMKWLRGDLHEANLDRLRQGGVPRPRCATAFWYEIHLRHVHRVYLRCARSPACQPVGRYR